MRIGVYIGPGAPSDASAAGETLRRLVQELGGVVVPITPAEAAEHAAAPWPVDGVIVMGAFAADAVPAAPAGGQDSPLLPAIAAFARARGPVLGIGGGFQILCAMGLLPGRVNLRVVAGAAPAPASHLRVEGRPTAFTSAIPAGRVMRLAAAAGMLSHPSPAGEAGRLAVSCYETEEAKALEARGQVIFRYCDAAGAATPAASAALAPAPRPHAIAGVCDAGGNVVGVLSDPGGDGPQLLRSLRMHLGAARS